MTATRARDIAARRGHLVLALLVVAAAAFLLRSGSGHEPAPFHQSVRVDAGGITLRAVRAGSGTPVILLHGFGESLMSWRGVFDRLAQRADVIALDLPGFGLSDKPASGYSNVAMAAAVRGAMDALGVGRAVLVGHSMGGAVALTLALEAPGRVAGLVLVSPAVSASGWGVSPPGDSSAAAGWMRGAIARYEQLRTRFTVPHDPAWLREDSTAARYLPADDPRYDDALEAVLREFDFDYLTPARAAQLRVPILVVWGEFDQVIPRSVGARMIEAVPSARLAVVPRSLHRAHVERPDTVGSLVLDFLSQFGTR